MQYILSVKWEHMKTWTWKKCFVGLFHAIRFHVNAIAHLSMKLHIYTRTIRDVVNQNMMKSNQNNMNILLLIYVETKSTPTQMADPRIDGDYISTLIGGALLFGERADLWRAQFVKRETV